MTNTKLDKLIATVQRQNNNPTKPSNTPKYMFHPYPPTNVLQYSVPTPKYYSATYPSTPTNNNQHTLRHPLVPQNYTYTPTKMLALQHMVSDFSHKINHIF